MLKNITGSLLLLLLIISCNKQEANLSVIGTVKGLKKGTLYLQKIEDTTLIVIDSMVVNGKPDFNFQLYLESPEMLYLYLDKKDGNSVNDRISFFAEPGEIKINTRFDQFDTKHNISGSALQDKYEIYKEMMSRFNENDLQLVKANIEAQREGDIAKTDSTVKAANSLFKRRYLYSVNFAMNNKDNALAPYIALSDFYDVNIQYLDTINNSLAKNVKESKYGKALDAFIIKRKQDEKKE
jgi:hypothetical protein